MTASRAPCIGDVTSRFCTAALLYGAACCRSGDCSACRQQREKMRKSGFAEAAVVRSFARSRIGLLDRCPLCGFPPPPPIQTLLPLPRLQRIDGEQSGSWACVGCERPLPKGRRRFHSDACRREFIRRTEMVGTEIVAASPPRIFRAHVNAARAAT
jgi:hypothetical protein